MPERHGCRDVKEKWMHADDDYVCACGVKGSKYLGLA